MSILSCDSIISPARENYSGAAQCKGMEDPNALESSHLPSLEFQAGLREFADMDDHGLLTNHQKGASLLQDKRLILFDFDGTIADAEQAHAASYAAAVEMCTGLNLLTSGTPGLHGIDSKFSGLFGPYEMESCCEAARVLKSEYPDFYKELLNGPPLEVGSLLEKGNNSFDPVTQEELYCANRLRIARAMAISLYARRATLGPQRPNGAQTLSVGKNASRGSHDYPWVHHFDGVRVTMQPGISKIVDYAKRNGIHLGVVTLSGMEFTTEIIRAFHLKGEQDDWIGVFSENVFPALKPHPEGWRKGLRLANQPPFKEKSSPVSEEIRPADVLVLENSVKGAVSALVAGMEVVVRDGIKNSTVLTNEYSSLSSKSAVGHTKLANRFKKLRDGEYNKPQAYRKNPGQRTSPRIGFLGDWNDLLLGLS